LATASKLNRLFFIVSWSVLMNPTRTSTVRQLPAYEMELVDVSDVRSHRHETRTGSQTAAPVAKLKSMPRTASISARCEELQAALQVRTETMATQSLAVKASRASFWEAFDPNALKRASDLLLSALALVALAPFLLIVAILIKLDSPGPAFYISERIGKNGRAFRCFKFRTMLVDAEARKSELLCHNERKEILFKIARDPRVTRVGRFLRKYSIDELPQFFNVLRGDMSIVGPRPPLASEVDRYLPWHHRRLDVPPGITGLWQVEARQDPSFDSYIALDLNYVDNWTVWLDFKIMLRTVGVVLSGTGA
jgi:exopolysaccharide biosynthesis polyprenyl glycosylphosphotransferase